MLAPVVSVAVTLSDNIQYHHRRCAAELMVAGQISTTKEVLIIRQRSRVSQISPTFKYHESVGGNYEVEWASSKLSDCYRLATTGVSFTFATVTSKSSDTLGLMYRSCYFKRNSPELSLSGVRWGLCCRVKGSQEEALHRQTRSAVSQISPHQYHWKCWRNYEVEMSISKVDW